MMKKTPKKGQEILFSIDNCQPYQSPDGIIYGVFTFVQLIFNRLSMMPSD